uniref:GLIPR1 like 1 n=1 Tax=Microcebus murinus TaxID=30608 RepID=A0A8C5V4E5_MICMU|nr:GLIPR1-like protein 1 [Microcebus murinus]
MALKKQFSCVWILGLCLVASKSSEVPSITDRKFIDETVTTHNKWRSQVNPPAADMKYMSWDASLAEVALAWAKKCKFKHDPCLNRPNGCVKRFKFVGQNIWLGGLKGFTARTAINSWHKEVANYNFNNRSCTKVCGHYTQVVWAKSYKVGCAVENCPTLRALFVCNYGPAGNYLNSRPYTTGEPCSLCTKEEKCVEKLCQNPLLIGKAPQEIAFNSFCLAFILMKIF